MISLALALVLTQAPDAPLVEPRPAVMVRAGDVVPFDGACLDDATLVKTGKRLAAAEASVAATDGKLVIAPSTVVVAVAAVVVVVGGAVAIGYVAGRSGAPKPTP